MVHSDDGSPEGGGGAHGHPTPRRRCCAGFEVEEECLYVLLCCINDC